MLIGKANGEPGNVSLRLNLALQTEIQNIQQMYNVFTGAVVEPFLAGLQALLECKPNPPPTGINALAAAAAAAAAPTAASSSSSAASGAVSASVSVGEAAANAFELLVVAVYRHAQVDEKRASRRNELLAYMRLCAWLMLSQIRSLATSQTAPFTAEQVKNVNRWMKLISTYGVYFFKGPFLFVCARSH